MVALTAKTKPKRKRSRSGWSRPTEDAGGDAGILNQEWDAFDRSARTIRWRSMLDFAEAEIVIPTGRYKGRRYRADRLPFNRLWFEQLDSGQWQRHWAVGPSQSSKTLCCFVIPVVYHLFERAETVIIGLPDDNMAHDKWSLDLEPVIRETRYASYLPRIGKGSRGGAIKSVTFGNGAVLRFMSAGGSDKARAGFQSRILAVTETDGFEASAVSHEADKIKQLEARLASWDDRGVEFAECTASVEEGRVWQEYVGGSKSKIVVPCPHCENRVTPEREHLIGWEQAEDEIEAAEKSHFCCPACGVAFTDEQRTSANHDCRLIHSGQSIDQSGEITGDKPRTNTLGFRWSAFNNLFQSSGTIGKRLWKAEKEEDEDNAERELCQFVFAMPYKPPILETSPLNQHALMRRVSKIPRGIVPQGSDYLTGHIDLGKFLAHYMIVAWWADGRGHIVDYNVIEIPTDAMGVEKATLAALREFRDNSVLTGWGRSADTPRVPDSVWIDVGWAESADAVYQFCRESGTRFYPALGRSAGQTRHMKSYSRPTKTGAVVVYVGDEYHVAKVASKQVYRVEVNADYWKAYVHERLRGPVDGPGALTIFNDVPHAHLKLAKHLTAERQVEEFVAGKGTIMRWDRLRKANHHLDNLYNAAAAGHLVGVRLTQENGPPVKTLGTPPARQEVLTTRDGRPFLATQRKD